MSPVGTGAETLDFLPSVPFVPDVSAFNAQTVKNHSTPVNFSTPALGGFEVKELPNVGIASKLFLEFDGTFDVETADATTGHDWPYGLLRQFKLSANGQNDLFSCSGVDLHVLRFARYPAYDERVDDFPGTVGGGDTVAVGTDHALRLVWEIPIAADDVSLVGSLFAQSSGVTLSTRVEVATAAELFSANPGNVTNFSGDWRVHIVHFEVPLDQEGKLITPDLSRLHGVHAVEHSWNGTGEKRFELIRSSGQLLRLFLSAERDTEARLDVLPATADSDKIDAIRLEYAGNKRPFVFDPASHLARINNQHYGASLPYDRVCLDLTKENPPRDALILQGVTELAAVLDINSGVTVNDGAVHIVQETLF